MSDRERWIVYPIVFLALVLGLNNYIRNGTNVAFGVLECNSIIVRSPDGQQKMRISGIGQTGQLIVYGAGNSPIFSILGTDGGKSGQVLVKGEKGSNVVLTASQGGSSVQVATDNLEPKIVLGYSPNDGKYGLVAYENDEPCVAITNDFGTAFYTRDGIRRAFEQSTAEFESDQTTDTTEMMDNVTDRVEEQTPEPGQSETVPTIPQDTEGDRGEDVGPDDAADPSASSEASSSTEDASLQGPDSSDFEAEVTDDSSATVE